MTDKCYDIGTIQAFLDGELADETTQAVARHVSVCDDCAILLATAEEESSFAFAALEQELNTLVPTQRLWAKINDSIVQEKKSFWQPIFAFFLKPTTAAFAGLLLMAVVSITLLSLRPDTPNIYVAETKIEKPIFNQPVQVKQPEQEDKTASVVNAPQIKPAARNAETAFYSPAKNEVRIVKAVYGRPESNRNPVKSTVPSADAVNAAPSENVLGEESYIKTIATLSATVNNRKDEVLSPSARFAFERDMAMTDSAIKEMRKEVKKNPNNETAKRILRSSYQNKIDLLNSVADRTELMASLK